MKCLIQVLLCFLLLPLANVARAGEVVDRIVAVVNRGVVLQSDLDTAVRYQALLEGTAPNAITQADVKAALERLIDQQLLYEQMGIAGSFAVSDAEAARKVEEIRSQFLDGSDDAAWHRLLQLYGLDEEAVRDKVKPQIEILKFLELRLRPNVRIGDDEISAYYKDEFLPRLRRTGAGDVSLQQVSGRIRQLLTERRIDDLLGTWLHNLREQSHIQLKLDTAQDPAGPAPAQAAVGKTSSRDTANDE